MNTKVSIQFILKDSDAVFSTRVQDIVTALTGNPNFASPPPSPALPIVQAGLEAFRTALANAADGGVTLTAIKNAKRVELGGLMRTLASYVQVTGQGDFAVLSSSMFPLQKPRNPIGVLPAPVIESVAPGARTGDLNAAVAPVKGAATYNWRVTTAAQPGVVVQTAQTTASGTTFAGLTPGVVYNIQAYVVGTAGPSDWSDPASSMVM